MCSFLVLFLVLQQCSMLVSIKQLNTEIQIELNIDKETEAQKGDVTGLEITLLLINKKK